MDAGHHVLLLDGYGVAARDSGLRQQIERRRPSWHGDEVERAPRLALDAIEEDRVEGGVGGDEIVIVEQIRLAQKAQAVALQLHGRYPQRRVRRADGEQPQIGVAAELVPPRLLPLAGQEDVARRVAAQELTP